MLFVETLWAGDCIGNWLATLQLGCVGSELGAMPGHVTVVADNVRSWGEVLFDFILWSWSEDLALAVVLRDKKKLAIRHAVS